MDTSNLIGLIALVVVFALEGLIPFYRQRGGRYAHAIQNLTLALSAAVVTAIMMPLLIWSAATAGEGGYGLCSLLAGQPLVCALVTFVLFDLWMYLWHRLNHRVPFLWRFHRVHHTDPAMDSTTAMRFHPGEILISTGLNCVVLVALGMGLGHLALYKAAMVVVILFHHSNLRIPSDVDRWLRLVIVTPSLHRVHHSHLREETDSDYGTVFSFWDRLFGSYRTRETYEDIRFGIGMYDDPAWQRPPRLLALPFRPLAWGGRG